MKLHLYTIGVILVALFLIALIVRFAALVAPALGVVLAVLVFAAAYDLIYNAVRRKVR